MIAPAGPSLLAPAAIIDTAKAAVAKYTQYLARELGPYGVTVNCVAPGYIATGRLAPLLNAMGAVAGPFDADQSTLDSLISSALKRQPRLEALQTPPTIH